VAFWAIAAKIFPPADLGVMTAVLAVIMSVAIVVATGVGDAYTALLPASGTDRRSLYRRGQGIFFALALTCGVAAAFGTVAWLPEVRGSIAVAVLVAVGVLVWSVLTLQNSTLVALGRARWLPAVNIGASVGKIVLLLVFAVTVSWHPVELSFVISAVVVIVVLQPVISRIISSGTELPEAAVLPGVLNRNFNVFVGQTVASSALTMGLLMVTPFLVTVYAGPKQGALFALSLSVAQALDFIGGALAMSLVVHAASAPEEASAMTRRIMIRAILFSSVGAAVLIVVTPTALGLLNPEYGALGATGVIAALALGSVTRCIYMVWSGLQKARRNMKAPLALNAVAAIVLLATMPVVVPTHGALGGAVVLIVTQLVLIAGIIVHYLVARRDGRLKLLRRATE
jgi:O-antigen/teichoic acid export membrane protein